MRTVTFITSNESKAAYLAKYLGLDIQRRTLALEELQSLDLLSITTHKARLAFAKVRSPVLVEDVALEFHAFGRLPGPLIKWFLQEMDMASICALLDHKDRSATAKSLFVLYDGVVLKTFEGSLEGRIAERPSGTKGFGGWDPIFIPRGYAITRAEMDEADDRRTYLKLKPFAALKAYLAEYMSKGTN